MKLDRNTIVVLSVISIVVLGLTALHFYNKRFEAKYQWGTNYIYDNDQPYGVSILYQLLNSYTDNNFEKIEELNLREFLNTKTKDSIATYFVIGNHCNYDVEDVKSLKKFAKKGNTVFLALEELPYNLIDELGSGTSDISKIIESSTESNNEEEIDSVYLEYFEENDSIWDEDYQEDEVKEEDYYYYDEDFYYEDYYYEDYYDYDSQKRIAVKANFIDSSLKVNTNYRFVNRYKDENIAINWKYFRDDFVDGALDHEKLGVINRNKSNFIRIKYGRGQILIHSNPVFFTNYHLLKPEAADYAAKVFSYFPEGPIYWDRNSKLWSVTQSNSSSGNDAETPFSYILKQKSLKWAFYMVWTLVILFVMFNLWRKQRAIPVKFPKSNSTLEFIHTIGELYFTQKNNRKLAIQKMNMFVKSVRTKYYITEKDEEKFIQILSKKSEIAAADIQNIFAKYKIIKNSNDELHDDDLVIFYQLLKKFTKNSK